MSDTTHHISTPNYTTASQPRTRIDVSIAYRLFVRAYLRSSVAQGEVKQESLSQEGVPSNE